MKDIISKLVCYCVLPVNGYILVSGNNTAFFVVYIKHNAFDFGKSC